jgi:hypothetical protein
VRCTRTSFLALALTCSVPSLAEKEQVEPQKFVHAIEKGKIRLLTKVRMVRADAGNGKANLIVVSPAEVIDRYRGCTGQVTKLPKKPAEGALAHELVGFIHWKCADHGGAKKGCYDESHDTALMYSGSRIVYFINQPFQNWNSVRCGHAPLPPSPLSQGTPNG